MNFWHVFAIEKFGFYRELRLRILIPWQLCLRITWNFQRNNKKPLILVFFFHFWSQKLSASKFFWKILEIWFDFGYFLDTWSLVFWYLDLQLTRVLATSLKKTPMGDLIVWSWSDLCDSFLRKKIELSLAFCQKFCHTMFGVQHGGNYTSNSLKFT